MSAISRMVFLIGALVIAFAMIAFLAMMIIPMDTSKTFSRTMSLQLASDIDGLLSAPVGTAKNYTMPIMECSVIFKKNAVNVTTKGNSYESPILIPEYEIEIESKQDLLCDLESERILSIEKVAEAKIEADIIEIGE